MRWPWRRPEPVDPHHGRDPSGRLHDGDRVRPDGWDGWADLLPGFNAGLVEPTQPLPMVEHPALVDSPLLTPGQRWRARGGGRR